MILIQFSITTFHVTRSGYITFEKTENPNEQDRFPIWGWGTVILYDDEGNASSAVEPLFFPDETDACSPYCPSSYLLDNPRWRVKEVELT